MICRPLSGSGVFTISPWAHSLTSRSVRILVAMASSEVRNSLKLQYLNHTMSRTISNVHLSPKTSKVQLMGQSERCRTVLVLVDIMGSSFSCDWKYTARITCILPLIILISLKGCKRQVIRFLHHRSEQLRSDSHNDQTTWFSPK